MFSSKNYQHVFLFVFTAKYFQIERLRNRHRQLQLEPRNKEKNRIIMQQQKTVALGKKLLICLNANIKIFLVWKISNTRFHNFNPIPVNISLLLRYEKISSKPRNTGNHKNCRIPSYHPVVRFSSQSSLYSFVTLYD